MGVEEKCEGWQELNIGCGELAREAGGWANTLLLRVSARSWWADRTCHLQTLQLHAQTTPAILETPLPLFLRASICEHPFLEVANYRTIRRPPTL
jgi:hypothetical protein